MSSRSFASLLCILVLGVGCKAQVRSTLKLGDVELPDTFVVGQADADGAIVVSFDEPPASLTLNQTWSSGFTIESEKPLSKIVLDYAANGSQVSSTFDVSSDATSFDFVAAMLATGARVRLAAVDELGRVGWMVSRSFNIVLPVVTTPDVTPPSPPEVSLLSGAITNSREVAVRVTCEMGEQVSVAIGLSASAMLFADCAAGAVELGQQLPDADGSYIVYVWARDSAGNISTLSTQLTIVLDREAPDVAITGLTTNDAFASSSTHMIDYTASDEHLDVTASVTTALSVDDGLIYTDLPAQPLDLTNVFSWTTPASQSGLVRLRVRVVDLAGNVGSAVSPKLVVTSSAPTQSRLWLNDDDGTTCGVDAITTSEQLATAHIRVTDPVGALITGYCVRTRSLTPPTLLDPCWRPVAAPAASLDLSVPVGLGYVPGLVTVRMWTKNNAGIISTLSSGTGTDCVDRRRIRYEPGEPPLVESVSSFVHDAPPAQPYTEADVTLAGSAASMGPTQVFVKWKVVFQGTGQDAMPGTAPGPVEISYAIGASQAFTVIASGVAHDMNVGGCTHNPATESGCYVWTPPAIVRDARYVRVRVRAVNALGISSASTGVVPLNQWPVRYLVGNPDPGYGGHALSTLFVSRLTDRQGFRHGTLAVSSLGVVYFLEPELGIFWVNPSTGIVETLLPKTGTFTDQVNGIATATAAYPTSLAIDVNDNLLFWDYNRIRRVNIGADGTPAGLGASVETIIDGAGGTYFLGNDQDPLGGNADPAKNVRLTIPPSLGMPLIPTYDGDIYFPSSTIDLPAAPSGNTGFAFRRYHQTENGPRVDTIYPSGDGYWSVASGVTGASSSNRAYSGGFLTFDQSGPTQLFAALSSAGFDGVATFNPDGTTSASPVGYMTYPSFFGIPYGFFFTGADGKLYYWNTWGTHSLLRYDPGDYLTTHVPPAGGLKDLQTRVMGPTGPTGPRCHDGDNALTCFLDVQDIFVDRFSVPYVLSQGQVFILQEDGTLARIFGGGYDEGRTGSALNVRFGYIPSASTWWDSGDDLTPSNADDREHIATVDALSLRIEESMLGNGVVNTSDAAENKTILLAGNGEFAPSRALVDLANDAPTLPLAVSSTTTIAADPVSGYVYLDQERVGGLDVLTRLRRDTTPPKFEVFAGGGAADYATVGPSGAPARDVFIGNQRNIWGFANGLLMVAMNFLTGGGDHTNGFMATFDADTAVGVDNTMSLFAGDIGSFGSMPFCGVSGSTGGSSAPILKENCHLVSVYEPSGIKAVHHDNAFVVDGVTFEPGWIISPYSSWEKYNVPDQAGTFVKRLYGGMGAQLLSMSYRLIGPDQDHLYGCTPNGVLVDLDLDTNSVTTLPFADFPIIAGARAITCTASHLEYNARRNSLEFSYQQAGLYGIAEYALP